MVTRNCGFFPVGSVGVLRCTRSNNDVPVTDPVLPKAVPGERKRGLGERDQVHGRIGGGCPDGPVTCTAGADGCRSAPPVTTSDWAA
jgi:hypothetical protein